MFGHLVVGHTPTRPCGHNNATAQLAFSPVQAEASDTDLIPNMLRLRLDISAHMPDPICCRCTARSWRAS